MPLPLAMLPLQSADWLMAVWLFALGGVIGSFLNVVVYRLPRGLSLVRPGSHCPACKHAIRWYDNVPVAGWLFLRGKCRDCGAVISPRYPIVEAITAGLFLLLAVVPFLSDGANLPSPIKAPAQILTISAYHLVMACTLLTAALIEWDGNRVPRRIFFTALAVGLLAPLASASLHPVAAYPALTEGFPVGLATGLCGLAAGGMIGWLFSLTVESTNKPARLMGPLCVGLFLGWQAICAIAAATTAIHFLNKGVRTLCCGNRRQTKSPDPFVLLAVTVVRILCWDWLVAW